jgi:8-oxo-dGTP pyrophosphatase MutT (NUDIX family)
VRKFLRVPQAGAITVRRKNKRWELCLVRKRSGKRWGIPKGIIDPGHTLKETALKETWEEAGLRGRLIGQALGDYEFKKWGGTPIRVKVFLMEVVAQSDEWPEWDWRERRWVSFRKADALLEDHPARPLLERARHTLDHR